MEKKLLTLRESLDLENSRVNELYKKHVNAGLFGIYKMLGFTDLDYLSAEGVVIKLKDGREILDFSSAIGILGLGHNHPKILEAEKQFLDSRGLNAMKLAPHKLQAALAYNISTLLPDPLSTVFFTVSGAESVEAAMKLCERAQGKKRDKFITTKNAYHGKTHKTLSVTNTSNFKDGFIQGISEENILTVVYGELEPLKKVLEETADSVIAMIIEPVQGQGVVEPEPGYLKKVVEMCHKYGVLVIFDEVKVGMARTGTFCAFQSEEVVPDVVTLSKALGGGSRAIGAMVTSEKLFRKAYGSGKYSSLHTTTFGGLGATMAVAIEAVNILGDKSFQAEVRKKGEYLGKRLTTLQSKFPNTIKEIRGRGLLQGICFDFSNVFPKSSFKLPGIIFFDSYEKIMMASLVSRLYKKYNILAHFSDSNIDTLHVMPPLIVTEEQIDTFISAIEEILDEGFIKLASSFFVKNIKTSLGNSD